MINLGGNFKIDVDLHKFFCEGSLRGTLIVYLSLYKGRKNLGFGLEALDVTPAAPSSDLAVSPWGGY